MERYRKVVRVLKEAGLDSPASRYMLWGMAETGEPFGAVLVHLSVYLGIRGEILRKEFAALCWPRPAPARFEELCKEVERR